MSSKNGEEKSLGMLQVIGSVLAAGFGVQSEKNRERDFKTGSSKHFIVVGLVATLLFVITLYTIVRLVLAFAGV
ncbi:MAG: DUF2970 domain-containing protein [Methylococcaceae bacterium]|nr:DUF2970 domain-containing protein [Methylococcaceae bacterium]